LAIFKPKKKPQNNAARAAIQEVTTHDLNFDGQGVARYQGKVMFIDGALAHERVRVRPNHEHKKFWQGDLIEVVSASPHRIEAPCPYFKRCGGCQLQHLESDQQIGFKQKHLDFALTHKLGLTEVPWQTPILSEPYGYRRRARLGIRYRNNLKQVIVGFREAQNSHLADINDCPVLEPDLAKLIKPLKQSLNELEHPEWYTQAEILAGDHHAVMSLTVIKSPTPADEQALALFAKEQNIVLTLRQNKVDQVLYQPNGSQLEFEVGGCRIAFNGQSFIQSNAGVNRQMIELALKWLKVSEDEQVLDLFAGLGNFTLPLARTAKQVTAVELDKSMVERLLINAQTNQLDNVRGMVTNLADANATEQLPWADVIILDPPRAGAAELMPWIAQQKSRVLYVACDPASLIRDAKPLLEAGYALNKIVVMDMFPQTKHVETMALFTVKDG